jgi:uncharacterized protein YecE (DUF72 family)
VDVALRPDVLPIRLGTSGYSFKDWVGPFYPLGTKPGEMLRFYAQHFSVVEVNSTYYRIPPPRTFARMAELTPATFEFMVKAPKSATHERERFDEEADLFLESIAPLEAAGKMRGILLQFPMSFRFSAEALGYLEHVRDRSGTRELFAEFRHDSWDRDDTFAFLKDHAIGYCVVDEPRLEGLMPPVVRVTTPTGYVRFHGRNARTWWARGLGDRYDYSYSRDELSQWRDKIRELVTRTERTYVFFNNCHAGQAVAGARLLAELMTA